MPPTPGSQTHTIYTVLEAFRQEATSNRDLGDRFERLMCRYFELDPIYADRFSKVWMWNEWPQKGKVGDVGIDLVAEERAKPGEFCAIQCKFYLPEHTLAKEDIDSFFTAAGKTLFTSCMIVSTTDKWSKNAEHALENQSKPVARLRVQDLDNSPIDWSRFSLKRPQDLSLRTRKSPLEHQKAAIADVLRGFATADRGKLIMACGTGKTFTSLCIAEKLAPKGQILFLVPSLSLLSQSLREWTAEATNSIHALAVCSDTKVGKRTGKSDDDTGDIAVYDLAFPATTSAKQIIRQYESIKKTTKKATDPHMTVVFSTYQSIGAVAQAQKEGLPPFDLIICDEAHRTTGVTISGEDESDFVKVHDAKRLQGKKRLYMTATPRIYSDDAKSKAKDADAELCSMDDLAVFGPEFHRLGFGEAVGKDLLADYKVLVLAVDEKYVSKAFQRQIADANNEVNLDDAVKITGCWNGLAKRLDRATASEVDLQGDTTHMKRAVAFSRSIKDSQAFTRQCAEIVESLRSSHPDEDLLRCELEHVDGTFDALRRNAMLDWLKQDAPPNTCRILSNARCLSEGVDVPALDAVLFLNPRKSVIDVVQAVGRVMRKAPGKKYGYILLPIGIPADMAPEEALKDNEKYKVVWQVLQALRAHDDRFNATINQIELNKNRPASIQVIGIGGGESDVTGSSGDSSQKTTELQGVLPFPHLEDWKDAIFARIVLKCGDRRYWESWAKDVAVIAERHTTRIKALIEGGKPRHRTAFANFLSGLRSNLNPTISEDDAIEMLSQHLITRPVFDALFENYAFAQHNPVSMTMQRMLDTLEDQALKKETQVLEKFYDSVRQRVAGIDNAEGRQRVVIELYDKFFRTAFPQMAARLGIVYTPIEVVDFIINSTDHALKQEFGTGLSDSGVHVLDPFSGTGTFFVRMLQSGLIRPTDLARKYKHELHANEIVLLAYYIAAINIEEAFHRIDGRQYQPFDGIVLTDTFQMTERKGSLDEVMFPENNQRVARQNDSEIRVIMGNPPYSVGQESQNDGDANIDYPHLDGRISATYAAKSSAGLKRNAYDSYTRAFRWASDRIGAKGVVCFVSNNSIAVKNSMDGVRKSLVEEFTSIYCFNLRGDQRTAGELSRQEGGKIFGSGSRAGIGIFLLVKNPDKKGRCKVFYRDIGDYLSQQEKLRIIGEARNIAGVDWKMVTPDEHGDWLNQRDPAFDDFMPLGQKESPEKDGLISSYSFGVGTNRDDWAYNFSKKNLTENMRRMSDAYNDQVKLYKKKNSGRSQGNLLSVESVIETDPKQISWSRGLKAAVTKGKEHDFAAGRIVEALYRPFCKQWLYFDRTMNESVLQMPKFFPPNGLANVAICVVAPGARQPFSALITNTMPDLHLAPDGAQCFPLSVYSRSDEYEGGLFDKSDKGYVRQDSIKDETLKRFRAAYGQEVAKEDIFFYVYGVLHARDYKERFEANLKKVLPRIPLTAQVDDFWLFSKAGRKLAEWHLNYETVEPFPLKEHTDGFTLNPAKDFVVQKMTFGRKDKQIDKTTIVYNSHLTLTGIPLEAYEYVVNGKAAIEWLMERYQVTKDKDSGITNDPNDWSKEHKQPRYIVDLVKRVVRVSLETMKIVDSLPALNERKAKVTGNIVVADILGQAQQKAARLRESGWTQADFAKALRDLLSTTEGA